MLVAAEARGQQPVAVQLPTFSFFSVNTTVSVPDSGAGIREMIRRESMRKRHRPARPFVGPRHVVGQPAAELPMIVGGPPASGRVFAERLSESRQSSAGRGTASVAAIRASRAAAQSSELSEAAELLAKGRSAEARKKLAAARVYYQMAEKRASGDTLAEVRAALTRLDQRANLASDTSRAAP